MTLSYFSTDRNVEKDNVIYLQFEGMISILTNIEKKTARRAPDYSTIYAAKKHLLKDVQVNDIRC